MASDVSTGSAGPRSSDPLPLQPDTAAPEGAAVRSSTDLRHFVRIHDGDLPPSLCDGLIASFHAMADAQQRNGRGVRAGLERSAWTELDIGRHADAQLRGFFRERISQALLRYNHDTALPIGIPDSPLLAPLVMKRYAAASDERFQLHFDAINEVSDRYLVFLWYLNDVLDGGDTEFPMLDLKIAPRRGRLLVFPPYWMYQHRGCPSPTRDKYILSTYLRFPRGPQSGGPQSSE